MTQETLQVRLTESRPRAPHIVSISPIRAITYPVHAQPKHVTPLHLHRHIVTPIIRQIRIIPGTIPLLGPPIARRRYRPAEINIEAQARPRSAVGFVRYAFIQAEGSDRRLGNSDIGVRDYKDGVSVGESGGDLEVCRREGTGGGDDGIGEAGRGGAGGRCGCGGGVLVRRRGGGRSCCGRGCGRGGGAADVVLDRRADAGDVADEERVYESRFDLGAQRGQIRSPGVIPRDLHGEERGREVGNPGLVLGDDGIAQVRSREFDRGEGANLLLDDGPVDGDTADLVQRGRIDDAAELDLVACVGEEFGVKNSGRELIDELLNRGGHRRKRGCCGGAGGS